MPHDDGITIGQIRDAARRIQRFASGLDRDALMADELRQSAIERQLFINLDILWQTIRDDVPRLLATLEALEVQGASDAPS